MEENKAKPRKTFITKLKNRYRLVVMNDDTYEEKVSLKLTPINVFTVGGTLFILTITLVVALIAFTPVREFIPGYSDVNTRKNALLAVLKTDSLENALWVRDQYIQNFVNILEGKITKEELEAKIDSTQKYKNIFLSKSAEDSILRAQMEMEDKYSISLKEEGIRKNMSAYFFFAPLNGYVTSSFNTKEGHYGVDIVGPENEAIKATLEGTVIFASWTNDNGYVLHLQHTNSIVSIYKHNSALLKKVGDYVKAGEPIAIIGSTGENSTGPHLHFELWFNGIPINPQEYIIF
jgi:murein DD-endopeptidase MepM/ murein hydrolase activator NlpD